MASFGISSAAYDDERIIKINTVPDVGDLAIVGFWMGSMALVSRNGRETGDFTFTLDDLEVAHGTVEERAAAVALLLDAELWIKVGERFEVMENGLWSLNPEESIDFYSGDT